MQQSFRRTARYASVIALPLAFAAAIPVTDGMTYEFVMKTTGKQTGNKEQVTLRGRGVYAGDDARIEILEASSTTGGMEAFGGKATYFIVKGGGAEMFLVNPTEKSYMKWDMANMLAGMSKVVNAMGSLVKMQVSDVKIDAHDMGAGPSVQGYPTKHIKMVQNYTMSASMFGKSSKTRSESTTDYYFATGLKIANPFVSNSNQMSQLGDMFNSAEYKSQMNAAMARLPKNGVPLKTVTTMVSTDEKGKQETMVSTMEMVNFKATNVPASEFAIPKDYALIEMPNLNAALAGGANGTAKEGPALNADSVAAAAKAGAAEGVKQGVKDATKEAAAKKLKGIFKR